MATMIGKYVQHSGDEGRELWKNYINNMAYNSSPPSAAYMRQ